MSSWRYIAQRLPSGEFLDWDLPLQDVDVTTALSAPGGLTATVPVEVARLHGGREAAERAMLSAAGKTHIVEDDLPPAPDTEALWLEGTARTPHVFEAVLDGGPVSTEHAMAAASPLPGDDGALDIDGGGP